MGLDFSTVGVDVGPVQVSWDDRDVMLYALGVGAGKLDACDELTLTTENSEGLALQVLPGFAPALSRRPGYGLSSVTSTGLDSSIRGSGCTSTPRCWRRGGRRCRPVSKA